MKTYDVNIAELALEDISEIFTYIAQGLNEPVAAGRVKDAILKCIDDLSVFPNRNPLIVDDSFENKIVRKTIVKNFMIFYEVKDNSVLILRVVYSRREWKNLV